MRRNVDRSLGDAFAAGVGIDAAANDKTGWNWLVAKNLTECNACGHTRLHHLGFRQPGCTYCGTCLCPAFQHSMKETA